MLVYLEGPDDSGYWFLSDEDGNSFRFVKNHEDHPIAAEMLGWKKPEGLDDEEAVIMDSLDWLMEHIGEEFKPPAHVEAYFKELFDKDDGEDDDEE